MLFVIKIGIFNVLLKPENIKLRVNRFVNQHNIGSNLILLGNLLYELSVNIQNQCLGKSNQEYELNNWKIVRDSVKI